MAMSDCPKCWETPCICGHEYKSLSDQKKTTLLAAIVGCRYEELATILDGRPISDIPSLLVKKPKGDMVRNAVVQSIDGLDYVYAYMEVDGDFTAGFECPMTGARFDWALETLQARTTLIDWMGTIPRDSKAGEDCPLTLFTVHHRKLKDLMIRDLKSATYNGRKVFQPFYVV